MHRRDAYERPVSFEIIDPNSRQQLPDKLRHPCSWQRLYAASFHPRRGLEAAGTAANGIKKSASIFSSAATTAITDSNTRSSRLPRRSSAIKVSVLRAGMNDKCSPFVKDEWMRRLFKEMGGVQETGTFANLYINGYYKYYYNPNGTGHKTILPGMVRHQ